jgi:hypothetical protein
VTQQDIAAAAPPAGRRRTAWLATGAWTAAVLLGALWLGEERLREYREQSLATATLRLNAIKDTLAITFQQLASLPLSLAHRTSVGRFLVTRPTPTSAKTRSGRSTRRWIASAPTSACRS